MLYKNNIKIQKRTYLVFYPLCFSVSLLLLQFGAALWRRSLTGRHHGSYSRGGGGMEPRWTGRETPAYDVKGVQSHTHTHTRALSHTHIHTHSRGEGEDNQQTANSPRSTEGSPNRSLTSAQAKLQGPLFIFVPAFLWEWTGEREGGKGRREEEHIICSKTDSCRIKKKKRSVAGCDLCWFGVFLGGQSRPCTCPSIQRRSSRQMNWIIETRELNNSQEEEKGEKERQESTDRAHSSATSGTTGRKKKRQKIKLLHPL